jgi:RNA polymerase sigma-70 factor (ECF subfamily)
VSAGQAGAPDNARFGDAFDALLASARHGDAWAWRRLWDWLAPAVAGYFRVQGVRDVDDLVSETFLGVVKGIARFEGSEAQFRSWVFVIAHRRVTDVRRAWGARTAVDWADDDFGGALGIVDRVDVEQDVLHRLAAERVRAICARLAPDQRDVLLLRLVGDLTIEQIAAVLGKTTGAVKALQRRGLGAVRKILEREGVPL